MKKQVYSFAVLFLLLCGVLGQSGAAFINYSFSTADKNSLVAAIDPKWSGALPFTLVVEPGCKIVYAKQGAIDPAD